MHMELNNYRKKFLEEVNILEFLKKDNKLEEDLMSFICLEKCSLLDILDFTFLLFPLSRLMVIKLNFLLRRGNISQTNFYRSFVSNPIFAVPQRPRYFLDLKEKLKILSKHCRKQQQILFQIIIDPILIFQTGICQKVQLLNTIQKSMNL